MTMRPVVSSNVDSVGYDPATGSMEIRFRNGGHYRSAGKIPAHLHAGLMAAESKGKFWHAHLKGKFEFEKVEE